MWILVVVLSTRLTLEGIYYMYEVFIVDMVELNVPPAYSYQSKKWHSATLHLSARLLKQVNERVIHLLARMNSFYKM